MHMKKTNLNSSNSLLIHCNRAKVGIIYLRQSTAYFNGQTDVLNISPSCLIFESNVSFLGKNFFYQWL